MSWIIGVTVSLIIWFIFWGLPMLFDLFVTVLIVILEKKEKLTSTIKKHIGNMKNKGETK